jgi:hypothetical protein
MRVWDTAEDLGDDMDADGYEEVADEDTGLVEEDDE